MQTLTHQYWLVKERQMELLAESQRQALLAKSGRTTVKFILANSCQRILGSRLNGFACRHRF